jgi:hypothetical protein
MFIFLLFQGCILSMWKYDIFTVNKEDLLSDRKTKLPDERHVQPSAKWICKNLHWGHLDL